MTDDELRQAATQQLRANDRDGVTVPSPSLYPHQWNWDSAFAAIGRSTFDPPRALTELERLLEGAWASGMVPHILFDPEVQGYEPGPRWWRTAGNARRPSSSITQPPVAATALLRVLERGGWSADLVQRARPLLPVLEGWHCWFSRERDPRGEGLPAIVHPWESGMDNAPLWDGPLSRVPRDMGFTRRDVELVDADQRPVQEHYERYAYLVRLNADRGFTPPDDAWPFLVQDPVLLALLLQAERDLLQICRTVGQSTEAAARAARIQQAMERKLLDPATGRFRHWDLVADRPLEVEGLFGYLPLYAGLGGELLVQALRQALSDPDQLGAPYTVPTMFLGSPRFERRRYWRGPCWVNTNWMLIQGLRRLGVDDLAHELRQATLRLVRHAGFWEYFDPLTGAGLGAEQFSWSAALALDLLHTG